ncbi:MAG: molybdopterin cofactor-binding domain-containing protein [Roseovarius sp.]
MGRARNIARRSFLIGSVAVLGGVAFGAYLVKKPHENPLEQGLEPGAAAFNPYVKITSDQITLIAPHADLGQGVQSAQAALIAEELDVDLDQVSIVFGQPHPAYYNTVLAGELAPFAAFDEGFTARTARGAFGAVGKVMGIMGTGGSTSIPDSFDKLRTAGAVARETLKLAASLKSGVPVDQLITAKGAVELPDGTRLAYTDLAADAAGIEPVVDVPLRDPVDWNLIGKPMQRTDSLAKSTGTQNYGIDVSIDGMVHAAVRTNPRKGGEMLGFDASAAKKMRGVQQVLTLSSKITRRAEDGTLSHSQGTVGVAVVADNTWRAFQAVDAIEVDWGPAPYPAEMDEHWQEVLDSFTSDRLDAEWVNTGDVDDAQTKGNLLQAEYRAPYVAHAPLEPLNAVIRADQDVAEVWTGHQMPRFAQQKVAKTLGMSDPKKIVFHNQFIGGSFGHRLELEYLTLCADIARQMPGVPIKLTYKREEDFAQDFPRQIGMARMTGTVTDKGIESYDAQVANVSTSASQTARLGQPFFGPDGQIVAGLWNMPFDIPNMRVRAYRVPELAPTSSWRSVGASSQGFFGESFMDELCVAADIDPIEERLRLINNDIHRKVLEAVAEMSNWGSELGAGRGRGVAMVESFGVPTAEVVEVSMTEDGIRIDKVFVAVDAGIVVDPDNFDNNVKGGIIWGLGHAMNCEITYSDGMAEQANYYDHEGMRLSQCPQIQVKALQNAPRIRGIGEPPVPPAAPALANAIFNATGQRLREMPFNKFIDFA